MTDIISRLKNNTPRWKILVELLKQSKKAMPTTSLSLLTGIHQIKIDQTLESLQKTGMIKRVTRKTVSYWIFVEDGEE